MNGLKNQENCHPLTIIICPGQRVVATPTHSTTEQFIIYRIIYLFESDRNRENCTTNIDSILNSVLYTYVTRMDDTTDTYLWRGLVGDFSRNIFRLYRTYNI